MRETPTTSDRLNSWKEIAVYLERDERTVQRWEDECGLPVHRTPGRKRGSVFAYKHELDAWLKGVDASSGLLNSPLIQPVGDSRTELSGSDRPSNIQYQQIISSMTEQSVVPLLSGNRTGQLLSGKESSVAGISCSRKWKLWAITACALGLVAIMTNRIIASHKQPIPRITHLQKLTNDGHGKANLRSDGTTLYFNEFEANREILLATPVDGGAIHAINTPFANVDLQDTSNDGQNLLVTSFEGMEKGGRPLWIIPAIGGTPRRVGDVLCDRARWSPDNRKVACANGGSILVFESDGSAVRTVGSFSSIPYKLLWSPQGDKLRFVLMDLTARTLTPLELTIKNDESTILAPVPLPLGKNCCWDWMWTRDDKNLLYTKRDANGRPALFMKPHNSWLRPETDLPLETPSIGDLVPGRTNAQLYLQMGDTYRGQLLKFDSRRNKFQISFEGLSATCLSFSRDGQWMTYRRTEDLTVWRSRADGSEAIQLTKPGIETEYSAWSPDGKQIALMAKYPGKPWRIFLIDPDGGAMKEAAHGSDNQGAPTWSPDGRMLVYGNTLCEKTQPCWIRRIDLATGTEELLPGSYGFRTARWSPNGKYILALQNETHELMLFDVRAQRWTMLANSITGDCPNWSSDSQYIYVDTLKDKTPVIERVRISDAYRDTVINLSPLQRILGQLDNWVGLAPDDSLLLLHQFGASEVYALEWTIQ